MQVLENFPLKALNTFGVEANAAWFVDIEDENDLKLLFSDEQWKNCPRLVLGGGSNMLFTGNFKGLVVHIKIQGLKAEVQSDGIFVTAGAGVVWNDLVNYCVNNEFAGIENLSLIPGSVGASPIQNIGAYGVELQDIFHSCRAFEISTGNIKVFSKQDCGFSYRDSVFKSALKGLFIITEVTFKLSGIFKPNVRYGAIIEELHDRGIAKPSIKDVSQVISHIRVSKLPDPATIGNAGSFFKNPVIPVEKFRQLQSHFSDIVHFPAGEGFVKISAGWLIEHCGWKGKVVGNTGTWKNQALVLVNHGKATGNEIFSFSATIIESVSSRFGIRLEREVNVI
ncbi:UDP-N-acetylmuramate dehydrogenase [Daejeonella rubra]|uniref:UDP-N-acetylenolpyruvoylglucosamine reductase n=1 Tax=Daejeonella rubra TaxID=990371 RepID=A0A1G9VQG3_9SPHI|nr:UDP-N-acetylmuramate dehydrogenase [Daejeonella rubra]SDM74462.1 UDP-N-acetylmuramate dehydrogenase [Daejeonella rubra]